MIWRPVITLTSYVTCHQWTNELQQMRVRGLQWPGLDLLGDKVGRGGHKSEAAVVSSIKHFHVSVEHEHVASEDDQLSDEADVVENSLALELDELGSLEEGHSQLHQVGDGDGTATVHTRTVDEDLTAVIARLVQKTVGLNLKNTSLAYTNMLSRYYTHPFSSHKV